MAELLKRHIGLAGVFSISAGAMISSGLFVLPGLAFANAGPAMIYSYLIAALLVLPSLFAKAELSTAMPKAGGTYFFIERSLGPVLGTYGGLANWFAITFKSAFALVGIGAFAVLIDPGISEQQIKLISLGACIFFTVLNLVSVKEAGRIQILMVFTLIAILLLYIGKGFILTEPVRYQPFLPGGWRAVFSTAGLVFISFGGLTKVSSIAEEVIAPSRNIPLGMFLAYFVVSLLYLLAISITVGVISGSDLSGSMIPLSLGARTLWGTPGVVIISFAAITAFFTTANSGILAASRSPLAMSRDNLLPGLFSRISRRFNTPYVAILLTSGFMVVVIFFLSIENLVKTASTLMILLFMMVNIAVIVMRESRIRNYRPRFKVPLYPWLTIFALVMYTFLLVEMGTVPLLISGGFFLLGTAGYYFYSRRLVKRHSALMHIVERVTARELKTRTLISELRDIVRERDSIVEDRFDILIKNCIILDYAESKPLCDVIGKISEILSERCSVDRSLVYHMFMEREGQSGTVVKPGLAIPHIIIPGENKFDVLPVRCRGGLSFSSADDPVHTMFVLIGSVDERNYHLRALMAIAQLFQDPSFEQQWMAAESIEDLRDTVLLSGRPRDIETSKGGPGERQRKE